MASQRMMRRIVARLNEAERSIDRHVNNDADPPDRLWDRRDALRQALELAEAGETDRAIRAFLAQRGVEVVR